MKKLEISKFASTIKTAQLSSKQLEKIVGKLDVKLLNEKLQVAYGKCETDRDRG
jgi:hypothetical protein